LSQFPKISQAVPSLAIEGLDCFVSFSLKANGILLGILKVWVENPDEIAAEDLEILIEVSDQIAIAIQQARLDRQNQNYTVELETKVAQRTAQLEEINRELKAFSYSISHDLKAPLRAIQGFSTALLEDYGQDLDDLGREYAHRLVSSAQQMEILIQDLLTYSRLSRSEIELTKVNLSSVVNKALQQLQIEIESSQAQITVEEPLASIYGNSTVLTQVVSNLISNAIKFVAPSEIPQIRISTETTEDRVRLWIEDNGIGIKPQHQSRIFQVFERLHGLETYPGTGIGLAIAKKGIERIGGEIGVESQINRGSRFWIEGTKS
jgi:light-regulated signal transduction histidine kinase (bacteriophytochrome)